MSETTSSPSVHLHALSPSSSMSSDDSAPQSEPTSDEQPDLGAFTAVLREFTHLQPIPRIPVQIRPATSSTTSTFQPEQSIADSEFRNPSIRSRNSRLSHRSGISFLSSFTRPPSSSVRLEGSTVWAHAAIAPYLMSQTPVSEEDSSYGDLDNESEPIANRGFTPSLHSPASTEGGRTVEIDFFSFDEGSQNHPESSPHPSLIESDVPLPVSLNEDAERVDSREPIPLDDDRGEDSSMTSRDLLHSNIQQAGSFVTTHSAVYDIHDTNHSDTESHLPSMHLQSQARPTTATATLSTLSLPLPPPFSGSPESSLPTNGPSLPSDDSIIRSSPSTMTLMNSLPARSRNPLPPRRISDSSFTSTNSATSSQLSLVSYEIPETPPISILEESDQDSIPRSIAPSIRPQTGSSMSNVPTTASKSSDIYDSPSVSLKTQRSLPSKSSSSSSLSHSTTTYAQRQQYLPSHLRSVFPSMDDNDYSIPEASIMTHSNSSARSLLPGSRSPMPTPEPEVANDQHLQSGVATIHRSRFTAPSIASEISSQDPGTPDQPPSESFPYDPPRRRNLPFQVVPDENDAEEDVVAIQRLNYASTSTTVMEDRPALLASHSRYSSSETQRMTESTFVNNDNATDSVEDVGYSFRFPHTPKHMLHARTPTGPPVNKHRVQVELEERTHSDPPSPRPQPSASTSQLSSSSTVRREAKVTRVVPFQPPLLQIGRGHNYGLGYPHSLLGLHALPTSLASPAADDLPSISNETPTTAPGPSVTVQRLAATLDEADIVAPGLDTFDEAEQNQYDLPSLGYLDEALSFIASERMRWTAAREDAAHAASLDRDGRRVGGEEAEDGQAAGDNETPKRKRRRKRPTKAQPVTQERQSRQPEEFPDLPPDASPKKKKRSKSASASLSSSSALSLRQPLVRAEDGGGGTNLDQEKDKAKGKRKEKEFLIPPPRSLGRSAGKSVVTILKRPAEPFDRLQVFSEDDSDDDGLITPTNAAMVARGSKASGGTAEGSLLSAGRIVKKLVMKEGSTRQGEKENRPAKQDSEFNIQYTDHNEHEDDDEGPDPQEEEDEIGPDPSLDEFSLLQPPKRRRERHRRQRARDTAYIHVAAGMTGAYKSTPGSPKKHALDLEDNDDITVGTKASEEGDQTTVTNNLEAKQLPSTPEKRKRTRSKRVKALGNSSSTSQLKLEDDVNSDKSKVLLRDEDLRTKEVDVEEVVGSSANPFQQIFIGSPNTSLLSRSKGVQEANQVAPQNKRGRLLTLAKKLRQFFPEQREELGRIVARFETTQVKKPNIADIGLKSAPMVIPGAKRKRSRKRGHLRVGSEGAAGDANEVDEDLNDGFGGNDGGSVPEVNGEEEDEDLDPRGRAPRKNDALIHVFIDHSNILIGLLSHLKRNPPPRSAYSTPSPALLSQAKTTATVSPTSAFAAKPTKSRLPHPSTGEVDNPNFSQPVPVPSEAAKLISLPSFVTMSRSLPAGSVLSNYMNKGKGQDSGGETKDKEVNSDGYEYSDRKRSGRGDDEQYDCFDGAVGAVKPKGKSLRHLWHAALALVLERGRPVTRRVVVTSSPLYQPMESIEHLGYELRVYMRVPDLGDGMDRERRSGKSSVSGKGSQSSPVTIVSFATLPRKASRQAMGHSRRISGSTSAESGSGSGGGSNSHPYHGITSGVTPPSKIKYREQGVDELLQLKLHQALAATDHVPEGSTIVLATGDGNIGQFNEDGFLGPVRTALKRGWRVELYAWEDGLSRAWRREFGESSEWGRSGMFRIIGMEQFASSLVEATGW